MNVSELKKEIESDKAFIEKVADRIYKDTDDWEETIPEPEWIDRMTEIADRYINRFELAQKIADKWIQCKTPQLNENQQVVLDWLKNRYTGNADPFGVTACLFSQTPRSEIIVATLKLTKGEQAQVLKIFANWTLEQVEDL